MAIVGASFDSHHDCCTRDGELTMKRIKLYKKCLSTLTFESLLNGFPEAPVRNPGFLNRMDKIFMFVMFAGCVPLSALWVPVTLVPHSAASWHTTVPFQGQQAV